MSKSKARALIVEALRERRSLVRKLAIGDAIATRPNVHEPPKLPKDR